MSILFIKSCSTCNGKLVGLNFLGFLFSIFYKEGDEFKIINTITWLLVLTHDDLIFQHGISQSTSDALFSRESRKKIVTICTQKLKPKSKSKRCTIATIKERKNNRIFDTLLVYPYTSNCRFSSVVWFLIWRTIKLTLFVMQLGYM